MIRNITHQTGEGAAHQVLQLYKLHTSASDEPVNPGKYEFSVAMNKEFGATAFESDVIFNLIKLMQK